MEAREAGEGESPPAKNISPRKDAGPQVDLAESSRSRRERPPTPTERIDARADRHIDELQNDKRLLHETIKRLEEELLRLHAREIPHHEEVRGLQQAHHEEVSRLQIRVTGLETTLDFIKNFGNLSSALITLGGGAVGFAAFLTSPLGPQHILAAIGFAGVVTGVLIQILNSYRAKRAVLNTPLPAERRSGTDVGQGPGAAAGRSDPGGAPPRSDDFSR